MKKMLMLFLIALSVPSAYSLETPSFEVRVVGSGQPMILIPGLSCHGSVWDDTASRFQGTHQLHILTLPGFGGAAPVEGPLLSRMVRELEAYIRVNHLDRPVVMGHSLGGFLALKLASAHPHLVGRVVSVDGLPFMAALQNPAATAESVLPFAKGMRDRLASVSSDQFAQQTRASLKTMISSPEKTEEVAERAVLSDPSTVARAVFEMMTEDLRDATTAIQSPVLLVSGLKAAPAPMWDGIRKGYRAQMDKIPNGKLVMLEEARHFVMLDAPLLFYETVASFLKDSGQGGAL